MNAKSLPSSVGRACSSYDVVFAFKDMETPGVDVCVSDRVTTGASGSCTPNFFVKLFDRISAETNLWLKTDRRRAARDGSHNS